MKIGSSSALPLVALGGLRASLTTSTLIALVLCSGSWRSSECLGASQLRAVLIGNSAYSIGRLRNPANDAEAMSKSLTALGFEVTLLQDLEQDEMEDAVIKFSREAEKESLAFLFFAGHGLQVGGENYLVPIDAQLKAEYSVRHECISLSWILDALRSSQSNLNVVVLDCCRDNPFARNWRASADRSAGLAAPPSIKIPDGTLIAFATAPGETAADGIGDNSPYTTALTSVLNQRPDEGLSLVDAILNASRIVYQQTRQKPWINLDASIPKFYLHPGKKPSAPAGDPRFNGHAVQDRRGEDDPISTNPLPETALPPTILELKRQADVYFRNRDYDNAIAAYGAIVQDTSLSNAFRQIARRSRGAAYLARGREADLDRAIIDQKASGQEGVYVSVRTSSPQRLTYTKDGNKIATGWVHQNQVVLITDVRGEWLWVKSVNGDESLTGYILKSAVLGRQAVDPVGMAGPQEIRPSHQLPNVRTSRTTGAKNTGRPDSRQPARWQSYGHQRWSHWRGHRR